MKPLKLLRVFSIFIAFTLIFTKYAEASGSKRPAVSDIENSQVTEVTAPSTPAIDDTYVPPAAGTIADKYSHVDPDKVVPAALLTKALAYYDANQAKINNKRYMVVIDFSKHNSKKRFFLIDMDAGDVVGYLTAHGKNSDPDFDGYATQFSNDNGSNMSSQGFYLTAETYYGEHGYSLRLDGLSSTNSNARARAIVIHGADYVTPGPKIGRSWGCPALDMDYYEEVISMIKGGTLIYAQ